MTSGSFENVEDQVSQRDVIARKLQQKATTKKGTYDGPGRKGDLGSFSKSSFSEFLRDPGTEWTAKRFVGV
jgi:hypothetical protein